MKPKLKLLFITNSLTGGGAERSANVIADELFDKGLDVHLVPINEGPRDFVQPRCKIHEMNRRWDSNFMSVFLTYFRLQFLLWRIKPTHIVLNCDLPELFGAFLIGNFKIIAVEHSSQPWAQRSLLGLLVRKILRSRLTIWVAVSDHLEIWGLKKRPNFVIPNPLPTDILLRNFTSADLSSTYIKRLVFIGRMSIEKNPELIVHLAHKTNLPLLFVGDGQLREQLKSLADTLGIVSSFVGQQVNPWDYCRDTDVIVVPSRFEGDGLVVVEAIAQGFPILLSDIPDLLRFQLPSQNYASTIGDFAQIIENYRGNRRGLVASDSIRDALVQARHPVNCANIWSDVLDFHAG
jgi:GalNAc-alpha-(1->4)-GalNAc-alpha-(1->3)-diNAcBac-PP-undecaprenol alpha-1,4-N-acetyl-D-galactosaminyltransferase